MPIPQSGWGLTPGTLEKNVTRSLGGKYGAIGKDPGTISDMLRTKYSSGLQAKSVKEASDLAKNIEANRKAESTRAFGLDTEKFGFSKALEDTRKGEATRAFGLDTEKFGFTQTESEKKWADALRGYELEERRMTGGWSQQDRDRALKEEQFGEELSAEKGWRASELSQRAREAASLASSRNASLAEQQAARKAADDLQRYLASERAGQWESESEYGKTQDEEAQRRWESESEYGKTQDEEAQRRWEEQQAWEKRKYYDAQRRAPGYSSAGSAYRPPTTYDSGKGLAPGVSASSFDKMNQARSVLNQLESQMAEWKSKPESIATNAPYRVALQKRIDAQNKKIQYLLESTWQGY